MKKLLTIAMSILVFIAKAQLPQVSRGGPGVIVVDAHLDVKNLKLPVYPDTASALSGARVDSLGLIFKQLASSNIWVRDTILTGGKKWALVNGSTGVSSFNNRSGIVTLTQGDILTGLGYVPASILDTGYHQLLATPSLLTKRTDSLSIVYGVTFLKVSNALSELIGVQSTARTNLGLGTSAIKDVAASGNASNTQVVKGDDTRLAAFTASLVGLVPAPGGSPTGSKVLADNGTWITQSGGSGSLQLVETTRGDSVNILGGNSIPIDPNPKNDGKHFFYNLKNTQAALGAMTDTTGYPAFADSTQFITTILMNSMGEHNELVEQHWYQYMGQRFASAGPGFLSASGNHYGLSLTAPVAEWTLLSAFTPTTGRGLDTYEMVSTGTGATADSMVYAWGGGFSSNDWTFSTRIEIQYYADPTYGTFRYSIDGVNQTTINTAVGTGPKRVVIQPLGDFAHKVAIIRVAQGTNGVHILGVYEYRAGKRGYLLNKVCKGSSTVQHFTRINGTDWSTMFSWLRSSLVMADWVVTSAGNEDTTTYLKSMDTIMNRVHGTDPKIDVMLFGPTYYSTNAWPAPVSPFVAYERSIRRYCQDSGFAFWNPITIYGKDVRIAVIRGILSSDSLHRTAQGSAAEIAQILTGIGILPQYYQTPPNLPTSDITITAPAGVREIFANGSNFPNGTNIRWHDVGIYYMLGISGNPGLTINLTNPLQVGLSTAGIKATLDFQMISTQPFTSNYASTAVGNFNATLPNANGAAAFIVSGGGASCTTCYITYATVNAGSLINNLENTNAGAGYSIYQSKTDGTGNPGFTAINNGVTAAFGQDHGASNAIKIGFGGLTFPNTSIMIPTSLNVLIGTTTDISNVLLNVASTTKAVLLSKMTNTQRDAITPLTEGMLIYSTTDHTYEFYNGTVWKSITTN